MTTNTDEIKRILADWRKKHGWRPGMVWDPYTAAYITPPPEPSHPPYPCSYAMCAAEHQWERTA
jgi:hypothetical protein